jgi:hypothetical protein
MFNLPEGQGWYTKRNVVYLAVYVQREKFSFSTKWRVDDPTLTLRKLVRWTPSFGQNFTCP